MPDKTPAAPEDETPSTSAKSKAKPKAASKKAVRVVAPWKFPQHTLEDALAVPKAIDSTFAGNPVKADALVKAVGFNKENDWRFLSLVRSSFLYGLTSGTGSAATIVLEKIGEDILSPGSSEQRSKALLAAFRNVPDFAAVEKYYRDKPIRDDEFFRNNLIRGFGIPRDRVDVFAQVFLKNLDYLKAFRVSEVKDEHGNTIKQPVIEVVEPGAEAKKEDARQFLDTCFMMMPFGHWNDIYYKEIYAPAIKDAGFEPIRGDGIFTSGSVVEQIWDEIVKAKVLLADLTGKNPNVFYELGLSHAISKPVVFTAGIIDDVPFDLRHLRVIIYDVRDPAWSTKLKGSITAYLKSAKSEPQKSIPQPFRKFPPAAEGPVA
jgi:hypothetical protein